MEPGRPTKRVHGGKVSTIWAPRQIVTSEGRSLARDEAGNIIVIVAVIMVLTFLSVAVLARTMSGLSSTRKGQDFSGALATADAGVSDALFRFDQLGSAPAATFC